MKNIKRKHFIQQIHVLAEEFQQVHRRDPKQALALCADIEELSITHDYKRGIALADLCRASAYFIQGYYTRSADACASALDIYTRTRNAKGKALALSQSAGVALFLGRYKEAITFALKSIDLAIDIHDSVIEATAMTTLGNVYVSAGEIQRGVDQLDKALQIYEELGDTQRLCGVLHNLSMAYFAQGNREQQQAYLEKSNALWRTLDDPYGLAISCHGLAGFYCDQRELIKAQQLAEESLLLHKQVGNENGMAEAILNLALALIRSGNTRRAIPMTKEAIATFEKLGHRRYVCNGLQTLAFAYYSARNKRKAYDTLTQALSIATDISARKDMADIYYALFTICAEWNDWKSAMHFQEEYYKTQLILTRLDYERSTENAELIRFADEAMRQAELYRATSEQLHKRVKTKERELERATLDFAQAKEFLATLKEQITEARYSPTRNAQKILDSVISDLHRYGRSKESWRDFIEHFDDVHDGFSAKLHKLHPTISSMEMKICTLLKLRLCTKDIASVLNIGTRTVENHRHRLRKKLHLPAHITLGGYLESL
ncbi:MAG: tetratricopeptide repeat protein [Candidatus Kapaibacterium sp.]|nr:tetratricopeptide repeat protein [Bacteroidota bacterium]